MSGIMDEIKNVGTKAAVSGGVTGVGLLLGLSVPVLVGVALFTFASLKFDDGGKKK